MNNNIIENNFDYRAKLKNEYMELKKTLKYVYDNEFEYRKTLAKMRKVIDTLAAEDKKHNFGEKR